MKLQRTYNFVKTEDEAIAFCNDFNTKHKGWCRHRATYTPWESADGRTHLFVVWYWR